ncbi:MAG: GtrA family protein [Patescibacteria group bacterium]
MQLLSWKTFDQLLKYVCIGAIASAADIVFLYFFTEYIGFWYVLSAGISYGIGFFLVFILNKYWSFQKYSFTGQQFRRFLLLMVANYLLSMLLIYLLTEHASLPYLFSKLAIIVIQVMWNFFLYKLWVYKN